MDTEQELVTLESAIKRLKLSTDEDEDDLQAMLIQAQETVLNYIARATDETWTATITGWDEDTVPGDIVAAILTQFGELYRFRGNDEAADVPKQEHGFLSPRVHGLLRRYRDPVIA